MEKQAQLQDYLSQPIRSKSYLTDMWNKYFDELHQKIITSIKSGIELHNDEKRKMAILALFPATWQTFAYDPKSWSFAGLRAAMEKLASLPALSQDNVSLAAIREFLNEYDNKLLGKKPEQPAQQMPAKMPQKPYKPLDINKVKQLQRLLGTEPTGTWNKASNTAFLTWLKTKGWDKYLRNNRFIGDINDAIRALLIEKATPTEASSKFTLKIFARLKYLNKLFDI